MSDTSILLLRWAHVIGACVLIGTGAGIAFFMLMAHRTRDPHIIAHVSRIVVIADFVFTASAVVIQPITGILLAKALGWPLGTSWIALSVVLYVVIGLFWLPVVWMQRRMHLLAREASITKTPLPAAYFRLYAAWFACGVPAFSLILVLVWLMLARPAL